MIGNDSCKETEGELSCLNVVRLDKKHEELFGR